VQAAKEEVAEAEAYGSILTTECESGIRAPYEVMQQGEGPPAAEAQCALVSGLLRVLHQAMDELEAEVFVAQPAAITYRRFS
jgi:hypothetical protein